LTTAASATEPWHPGSRVARLKASHSYLSVLLLVFATFVFITAAPEARWAQSVIVLLECGTLILALWTSGLGEDFRPGLVIVSIATAAAVLLPLTSGDTIEGIVWIFQVVLAVGVVAVLGLGVVDQDEINKQSILGAICAYVLLGLLFTFIYGAAAELGSGSFFAQGTDGTASLRLYFSYVTLATLGYGDYTPAGDLGHALAVLEALMGQLYLVTVLAVLVSRLGNSPVRSE
jgi:hypothetical protein